MSDEWIRQLKAMLIPAGSGVFTVQTAKEKKATLQQRLYGEVDNDAILGAFFETLDKAHNISSPIGLLGIASDNGGGILRGANWGPLFIREKLYQQNLPKNLIDFGDIKVIPHLLHDKYLNQKTLEKCQKALYDEALSLPVSPLSIAETTTRLLYENYPDLKLLALGGDHSVSYPLAKSYLLHKEAQGVKVGLIHFDAHTDLLSERLGIDLCFGSWLTHILPFMKNKESVIQIGLRASGKDKNHWQSTFGVTQYWANDVKQQGVDEISECIYQQLKKDNIDELYISFDIDALDCLIAPATGTPEPNGLSLDEATSFIQNISQSFNITGADLVEVAPLTNLTQENAQKTTLNSANAIAMALLDALHVT